MKHTMLKKIKAAYKALAGKHTVKWDFHNTYPRFVTSLKKFHHLDDAMELAVGGEFEAIGTLERELLVQYGLSKDGYLIDVGCGSGRLAKPLSQYHTGKYLGIDVVPELVAYARNLVNRPDWRFETARGLSIPEEDGKADVVCFFSVFTHLLHEQTYTYLKDAKRVLKPDGRIVFSFLEYAVQNNWKIFELSLEDVQSHLNPLHMFISRDAIEAWASHLDLKIVTIQEGDKPHIELSQPVTFKNGRVVKGKAALGQSVCVLSLK